MELNVYDYGARTYDPAAPRFWQIDPLAEKYSFQSVYVYADDNPVFFVDINGMGTEEQDWIPQVDVNGSVSYIAEDGDSAKTLASQYNLSLTTAEKITETKGDEKIEKGTKISGQAVLDVTGSEVLKLDLNSKEGKSSQRRFDQFLFASDLSRSRNKDYFLSTDFYQNTKYKSTIKGWAKISIDEHQYKLYYEIPLYRPATFDQSSTSIGIGSYPTELKQTSGIYFRGHQENLYGNIYHPDTGNKMGQYWIFTHQSYSKKIYNRLNKDIPKYHYIRTPFKF